VRTILAVLIGAGLWSPLAAQTQHFVVDSAWAPTRIEQPTGGVAGPNDQGPNVLHFRNGRSLAVHLFDVQFLGQLPRPNRPPFLLLGARGCHSCDIETQLFVVTPRADSLHQEGGAYGYAGTLRPSEPPDTAAFHRARLFVGRCLTDGEPTAVWFQAERDSTGKWKPAVYRLRVVNGSLHGAFLTPRPRIERALEAVKAGSCYEIPGIDDTQG